jgi:hypothetical protein
MGNRRRFNFEMMREIQVWNASEDLLFIPYKIDSLTLYAEGSISVKFGILSRSNALKTELSTVYSCSCLPSKSMQYYVASVSTASEERICRMPLSTIVINLRGIHVIAGCKFKFGRALGRDHFECPRLSNGRPKYPSRSIFR